MRFANPAWEAATGQPFAKLRGTRITPRKSATALGNVLAPPPEAWAGEVCRARRPAPGEPAGPPWWDFTFLPLLGDGEARVLGVVGILTVVGSATPTARVPLPAAVAAVRAEHAAFYTFERLGGASAAAERLTAAVRAAAIGEMPVWVVGEAGSGKETVARVIHHHGPRRERAFVGLNCGGLQPYLIDGLLFGKGGASGGRAVGTLYLKNPEDLTPASQGRLLQWCESAAGPRLICGSTKPAAEWVAKLDRLLVTKYAAFEISVPALRSRPEDLPLLLARMGGTAVPPDVLATLKMWAWPGNLRELAGVVAGGVAKREQLPRALRERRLAVSGLTKPPPPLDDVLAEVERRLIRLALAEAEGNQPLAAERLGIPRGRLYRRMAALGIQ